MREARPPSDDGGYVADGSSARQRPRSRVRQNVVSAHRLTTAATLITAPPTSRSASQCLPTALYQAITPTITPANEGVRAGAGELLGLPLAPVGVQ